LQENSSEATSEPGLRLYGDVQEFSVNGEGSLLCILELVHEYFNTLILDLSIMWWVITISMV